MFSTTLDCDFTFPIRGMHLSRHSITGLHEILVKFEKKINQTAKNMPNFKTPLFKNHSLVLTSELHFTLHEWKGKSKVSSEHYSRLLFSDRKEVVAM